MSRLLKSDADRNHPTLAVPPTTQQNLLTLVTSSERYCHLVVDYVPEDHYSTREAKAIAKAAYAFVRKHNKPPLNHLPDLLEKERKDEKHGPLIDHYILNIESLRSSGGFNEEFVKGQLHDLAQRISLKHYAYQITEAVQSENCASARMSVDELYALQHEIDHRHGVHELNLVCADEVKMKRKEWLWDGFLCRGKVHLIAGLPETLKSTILLSFAAAAAPGGRAATWRRDSRGKLIYTPYTLVRWPDMTRCADPGDVLIYSGEDDWEDTVKPRLRAANADMSRIHKIGVVRDKRTGPRPFDYGTDMPLLRREAARVGPANLAGADRPGDPDLEDQGRR